MKLKKILAVTIGATLALSTALALTACGDDAPQGPAALNSTDQVKIADYVTAWDAEDSSIISRSKKAPTVGAKINETGEMLINGGSALIFAKGDTETTYRVYSVLAEKNIATGLKEMPQFSEQNSLPIVKLTNTTGEAPEQVVKTEYMTADGVTVLPSDTYTNDPTVEELNVYVNDDDETSSVYKVTAVKTDTAHTEVVKYVAEVRNDEDEITGYKLVEKSALSADKTDIKVGDSLADNLRDIYESTDEQPVEGAITDYKYTETNDKYTFYKDGTETGSVTIEYGLSEVFVGNYLYYTTLTPVPVDATSGYNYEATDYTQSGIVTVKGNYSLYRYDIVNNTSTQLNYNVAIVNATKQYNYTTKAYDAAVISCVPMYDGIYYVSEYTSVMKTYLVDSEMNIGYDLTYKVGMPEYKLDDGKYLVSNYRGGGYVIADENLDYVTDYAYNFYDAEKVFKFYDEDSHKYGIKDYDGKVVVAPVYDEIGDFYDGYALANKTTVDGTETVFLSKSGTERKLPENSNNETTHTQITVSEPAKGWYKVTTRTGEDYSSYKYKVEFFNYAGTSLKAFTDLNNYSALNISLDSPLLTDDTDYYLVKK